MNHRASEEYLRNAVMTASPEQLQLMLYDGAIRFARLAREAIRRSDWETGCDQLIRAQRIVAQLQNGLRADANPELCDQLARLYGFIYQRLVTANVEHETAAIDEALQILEHQRETWRMLLSKVSGAQSPPAESERSPVAETVAVHG
jgi:flagellar protein FliS